MLSKVGAKKSAYRKTEKNEWAHVLKKKLKVPLYRNFVRFCGGSNQIYL